MNILFLHRNFPAQFVHLAQDSNNKVVFITTRKENELQGVSKYVYTPHRVSSNETHRYLKFSEEAIIHGQDSAAIASQLKNQGFAPDVILGHAWGQTIFMKDVFPNTPLICYFDWFYNAHGSDVDFEDKVVLDIEARVRIKNSHLLVDLYSCDYGICATQWQKNQFPKEFSHKIEVIHDGIDTDYFVPVPESKLIIPNLDLSGEKEIITYVSRGMETYRGFHKFMESADIILKRRPDCHVVIVGEDRVCYGPKLPDGKTFKQVMLERLDLDMTRVHFTGRLPYEQYLKVLQASSAHVYLTYPFVLSWSMLEAMSAGCVVIGSDTPPVKEVIQDGYNGLLTDFFSPMQIADKVDYVLNNQDKMQEIRQNARETIVSNYDLKALLPKQIKIIEDRAGKPA